MLLNFIKNIAERKSNHLSMIASNGMQEKTVVTLPKEPPKKLCRTPKCQYSIAGILAVSLLVLSILFVWFFILPPHNFPSDTFIRIQKGDTVSVVATRLADKKIIKSPLIFKVMVRLMGGDKRLLAGSYFFRERSTVATVAMRLTSRFLGYSPYRVTVFEGLSNRKIATLLAKTIPNFDQKDFLAKTENLEGQLFPDTYFFSPLDTPSDIIFEMNNNFQQRLSDIQPDIQKSGRSLNDILTMASILERETITTKSRRVVSGILWKRISLGMPLQVDASFEYYIYDRNTFTLTKKDLKSESPYNTYINKGLPPTPIANPGQDAIMAAIYPELSPYLYYLSDRSGNMHYAKDFKEHVQNRRIYGI
ncbi:MAG: endolytic transglycosylase MltG [Candidatus Vogelbacteria bacterium]|nr:endolytic transglycosylase MltG [Candidatus Vogelbacteria bacterium]